MGAEGTTIADVLEYVRGTDDAGAAPVDGWQDRAREAIAEETAKGDGARPTLIAKLEEALATEGPLVADPVDPDTSPDTPDALAVDAPADEGDGTAWYSHNGQAFHVTAGSEAEKRLRDENADRIDAPA